jgi:hypothetical protein
MPDVVVVDSWEATPRATFECTICCEEIPATEDKTNMTCCSREICRGCSHRIYFSRDAKCPFCRASFVPEGVDPMWTRVEEHDDDDFDVDAHSVAQLTDMQILAPTRQPDRRTIVDVRPGDREYFRRGRCLAYRNVGAWRRTRCRQRVRGFGFCPSHRR